MRRRLFWTINGVAALTGLLVLIGAAVATQRAAIDATQRELTKSSAEVVSVINDTVQAAERRPGAVFEIFRHLEGELGPVLGRIRRSAGSSDLAFAAVAPDGSIRTSADLFARLSVDPATLAPGESRFVTSSNDELVMLTATSVPVGNTEITLVVALAREAPVVRLSDLGLGLGVVGLGMILISAALARLLSNQIVSRLEPLSGASRRLAEGDLSVRVPPLGDPDLDQLGESFNEMASEIEATRDREREFILGVGHDLRTPLTTIAGYAEALEAEDLDPEDVARIGGVLGTQSRQLGRLIEDLSLLARLEQPEFSLRRERVDVGAHVSEIVDGFQRKAGQAGIKLHFEAESDLVLDTDPDRLGQIAQNLVENALRYTPEAGRVSVTVASGEGPSVVISVADTGVGIEADDLPHIFDRHYVGRHRRIRNEGTGLGLSIVEGLTERLGGDVVGESSPGKGTTITVRLPM
ncbi:MAG: HAMP domain-containing histidine kinase [Acidobacteria bacterium]|nr:HAMP domain-containing histidine kinase [Acidobacteriota bacterium]